MNLKQKLIVLFFFVQTVHNHVGRLPLCADSGEDIDAGERPGLYREFLGERLLRGTFTIPLQQPHIPDYKFDSTQLTHFVLLSPGTVRLRTGDFPDASAGDR